MGGSGQIDEITKKIIYTPFLRNSPPGQTTQQIFTLIGSNNAN